MILIGLFLREKKSVYDPLHPNFLRIEYTLCCLSGMTFTSQMITFMNHSRPLSYFIIFHDFCIKGNIGLKWVNNNPFAPNAAFLYPLKTFWWFKRVEKGCIGNKWINKIEDTKTILLVLIPYFRISTAHHVEPITFYIAVNTIWINLPSNFVMQWLGQTKGTKPIQKERASNSPFCQLTFTFLT